MTVVSGMSQHRLNDILLMIIGKHRRLTFVECNNDMNSMIDIGKVADLVDYITLLSSSF